MNFPTTIKVAYYCIKEAVLHPLTTIENVGNPVKVNPQSPIPWWGSITILTMGIAAWCVSACVGIEGLDEAGRAMVYIPLGNIFGMSLRNGVK